MKWSERELEMVSKLRKSGKSIREIASTLNRSYDSIRHIIRRYNFSKTEVPKYVKNFVQELDIDYNLSEEIIKKIKETYTLNWKIAKSTRKTKKKEFKSYLVIADVHVPYQDDIAIRAVLKLMEDIAFDGFIILGDFMELDSISHWLLGENKLKSLEGKRIMEDYAIGNALLDEFDKRLPKDCDKRFFGGNHESGRYDAFIEKYPMLEGLFDPFKELKLEERGYIVYRDLNHIERIGKLSFTHGIFWNKHFLAKHIDEFKTNVLIAHVHTPRMRLANSPAKETAIFGGSVGCLTNLNPEYNKNKPNKTAHGFAVVHFYDDGIFDVDIKRIVKGKFVYNGKLYDGNK